MISVDRTTIACPIELSAADSKGKLEQQRAICHYSQRENHHKKFAFEAYSCDSVKTALNELFKGKCAYCESRYEATQPMDIEHFRPKAGVMIGRILKKPGYYWLAAEWDNLLPSCIDCNRRRTQNINGRYIKSGKENHFPIVDERLRATQLGEESREQPLLLNPCCDNPDAHMEFADDGVVRPKLDADGQEDRKGRLSIDIYGLQRKGLVTARSEHALLIRAQMRRVRRAWIKLTNEPGNPELRIQFDEEWKDLKTYTCSKKPYACMARQMIRRFKEDLRRELE